MGIVKEFELIVSMVVTAIFLFNFYLILGREFLVLVAQKRVL